MRRDDLGEGAPKITRTIGPGWNSCPAQNYRSAVNSVCLPLLKEAAPFLYATLLRLETLSLIRRGLNVPLPLLQEGVVCLRRRRAVAASCLVLLKERVPLRRTL